VSSLASESVKLALRDLDSDVSSHHLVRYAAKVDGYLVTAKNSGTHGLRFMLSVAIAHHLGLAPPERSSGPSSDAFIGHPKHGFRHAQAPRIGSSHNIPSRLLTLTGPGAVTLPPTVVLVRDIREALLSYYVKWAQTYDLGSLPDFLRRPAPGKKKIDDLWWFIRFFNRWGEAAEHRPNAVLVVRHEDIRANPGAWVRRIWSHWGVTLSEGSIAAAVAVSSKDAVARNLDPAHGETIVPDKAKRNAVRLSAEDEAYLAEIFARHLHEDFGYGLRGAVDRLPAYQA
jgi:hypothetical protein